MPPLIKRQKFFESGLVRHGDIAPARDIPVRPWGGAHSVVAEIIVFGELEGFVGQKFKTGNLAGNLVEVGKTASDFEHDGSVCHDACRIGA